MQPLSKAGRRIAERIDRDEFEWLGIGNTQAPLEDRQPGPSRRRRAAPAPALHELLRPPAGRAGAARATTPARCADGYLLDTSMRLPHLERLIEASEAVIAERGGRPHTDRKKPFIADLRRGPRPGRPSGVPRLRPLPSGAQGRRHLPPPVPDPLAHAPARRADGGVELEVRPRRRRPLPRQPALPPRPPRQPAGLRDRPRPRRDGAERPVHVPARPRPRTGSRRRPDTAGAGRPYRLTDEEVYRHVAADEAISLTLPEGNGPVHRLEPLLPLRKPRLHRPALPGHVRVHLALPNRPERVPDEAQALPDARRRSHPQEAGARPGPSPR